MKRTCQMIITLCLPLVLCGPVRAQHAGPYVGAFFGGNALLDAKSTDSKGTFNLEFDPGIQGGAVVGWDFAPDKSAGEGRIELEYAHRSNQLDKVKFVEGNFSGGGDVIADSLLLNFIGVYREGRRWAPYLLVGLGAASIEASDLKVTGKPLGNDSSVVFAYQVGTGIDFMLTKNLNIDLGYRFFGSSRPEFSEPNGLKFEMDYYSHNVIIGLRVGF
jgi:opacity protein-like surface antigen